MHDITIAKTILTKRRERGLTQDELADFFGVTKASVSKWEKGQSYPDISLLPRIAAFFGISIDEVMGYTPQLEKEEIKNLYLRFATGFSAKPFGDVMAEVRAAIKSYYTCYPFLLQMVILIMNHFPLAQAGEEQAAALEDALTLCRRIKAESGDISLERQANTMEAALNLMQNRPGEVVELLSGTTNQPFAQDEMLLASAYEQQGDEQAARQTLQVASYQLLLHLVGSAVKLLPLYQHDSARFDEILRRNLAVADAFELDALHPNALIQLTITAALCLAGQGDCERALALLERSVEAYEHFEFPAILHGDDYFDLIDSLFETYDLGENAPRDIKLVKKDFLGILEHPAFASLFERPEYKRLLARAKAK